MRYPFITRGFLCGRHFVIGECVHFITNQLMPSSKFTILIAYNILTILMLQNLALGHSITKLCLSDIGLLANYLLPI